MIKTFNYKQKEDFKESILNIGGLLDDSIEWIQLNLEPEDVFDEAELKSWAENNGYTKED